VKNDPLLQALGALAREQDPTRDPRWDELAAGEVADAQRKELREDAAQAEGEAFADEALEAFRPMGGEAKDRFVDAILAEAGAARVEQAKVIPLRRAWWAAGSLGALAAAAAVLMLVRPPGPAGSAGLPSYDLVVSGGESGVRALTVQEIPKLAPGSRLEVVLRPATRTEGPIVVRGAMRKGEDVRPWTPAVETDPDGAARITGTREALFADTPTGRWTLVIAVGRPDVLPSSAPELFRLEAGEDPAGARLRRIDVELIDP
jgi:hypothetical protein